MADAVLVGQVVEAVSAAAGRYGSGLVAKAQDAAADASVHVGARMLQALLERDRLGWVLRGARQFAEAPPEQRPAAREKLARAVADLLDRAPEAVGPLRALLVQVGAAGAGSVAAGPAPAGAVSGSGDAAAVDARGASLFQVGSGNVQNIVEALRVSASAFAALPPAAGPVGYPGVGLCLGRDALVEQIHRGLGGSGGGSVVVQAVAGLGGVGKTTLAAQYVSVYGHRYRQVVWMTADGPAGLTLGLVRFALALAPDLAGRLPDEALEGCARAWLAGNGGWLAVLDNVADPRDVKALVASAPGGVFLATSRRTGGWGGFAQALSLGLLAPGDARALVERVAGGPGSDCWTGSKSCAKGWVSCRWRWNRPPPIWPSGR